MTSAVEDVRALNELESDYVILGEIGRGATSHVYRAQHRRGGHHVAIKVVSAQHLDARESTARFHRESRVVARLDHPNIVRHYEVRRLHDGGTAFVMQYVAGTTLAAALQARPRLPFDDAERVLRDLANALGHAHRSGVVHRDVKPANIFLDRSTGAVLLADFGIAKTLDRSTQLTRTGAVLGTPTYMSPEQVDGDAVDGRSDLYSLGLVGWEMLVGVRPWQGESLYSVLHKQKHEHLPPIAEVRPDVPQRLVLAIEGTLHKDPAARWSTADHFLQQLARDEPVAGFNRRPTPAGNGVATAVPGVDDTVHLPPRATPAAPAAPMAPATRATPKPPAPAAPAAPAAAPSPSIVRPRWLLAGGAGLLLVGVAAGVAVARGRAGPPPAAAATATAAAPSAAPPAAPRTAARASADRGGRDAGRTTARSARPAPIPATPRATPRSELAPGTEARATAGAASNVGFPPNAGLAPNAGSAPATPARRAPTSEAAFSAPASTARARAADLVTAAAGELARRRVTQARTLVDRAVVLNPRSPSAYALRARVRLQQGEVRDAWADAETAALSGDPLVGEAIAVVVDARVGETWRARSRLKQLVRDPAFAEAALDPWRGGHLAMAQLAVGDREGALGTLERVQSRRASFRALLSDPSFDALRSTPRFQRLLERAES